MPSNPHEIHKYAAGATTPTKYYYVLNLQGDVIQIRDTSNAVVANYTYDSWGRLLSVKNPSGSTISDTSHIANVNPIRYRGYFYDTETKLYYCNSRYYDPQVKRFINADELLSTGQDFIGYNMFAYCNNNPVMYSDPSGCILTDWDKENLTIEEQGEILYQTERWNNATTEEQRYDAHAWAYMIRYPHLKGYELILPNGYVVSTEYTITYRDDSSGYDIVYTIKPTAISVDVCQRGLIYLYESDKLDILTRSMLNTYRNIFGLDFADRSVKGMTKEIIHHYCAYKEFHGSHSKILNKLAESGKIADLECSYFIGTHNYWVFE